MKRTLFFQDPVSLSLASGRIMVCFDGKELDCIPVEDVGMVMIENPKVSVPISLVLYLSDSNVPVVYCDSGHCPSSITMPLKGHCMQGKIVREQLCCMSVVSDGLWREIVRRKILSQVSCLTGLSLPVARIVRMAESLSDEKRPEEVVALEGVVTKEYYRTLFGREFRRDRYGNCPNNLLNYGYSVLRSIVVKELVSSGLFLGAGLYHGGRNDEFPLAGDVMEPYRIVVDRKVYDLYSRGVVTLDPESRREILSLFSSDVTVMGYSHALSDVIGITAVSVARILTGDSDIDCLVYPDLESNFR